MVKEGLGAPMPSENRRSQDVSDVSANSILTAPVSLSGSIKWFDVAKGFGFVVPDGGGPDILLHVTCLQRDGFRVAYEGTRLVFEAIAGRRGWQVLRIVSMDLSTAVHPSQLPPPRTHVAVTPTSPLVKVRVKWFNRLRGFGFANEGEGSPDIFLHMEVLRRYGLAEVRPDQELLVRYGPGEKGLMASEIRLVDGEGVPFSH
ncbi:MAG: cold-shock protein [Alphaproteobacteria bacterium]|jgi:CspA family cold shock protein|nr:cold shock domain-containing protein [Beijerinckiaceae bacterium]NBQ39990.1 cold-shock protein [Alphaproteobacteria bacterium]